MNITVNGEVKEVSDGLTVPQLLEELAVEMPDMVTVQLNGTILDRKDHNTTALKKNDEVEFLYFMGGGKHRPPIV